MQAKTHLTECALVKLGSSDAEGSFSPIERLCRHVTLCVVLALTALVSLGGTDTAWSQGNNIQIQCDGSSFTRKVCRDGVSCQLTEIQDTAPSGAASSPQDRLVFNVPPQGATVSYVLTNPTVSGLTGQDDPVSGTIIRQQPVNADLTSFSVAKDGTENYGPFSAVPGEVHRVDLDNPDSDYALAVWEVKCEANEQPANTGNIVFKKVTTDSEDNDTFKFSIQRTDQTSDIRTFDIMTSSGMGERGFPAIPVGTYEVKELAPLPNGWTNTELICQSTNREDEDTKIVGNRPTSPPYSNVINLEDGETVACTWQNEFQEPEPPGKLIVRKKAIGGGPLKFPFEAWVREEDGQCEPNGRENLLGECPVPDVTLHEEMGEHTNFALGNGEMEMFTVGSYGTIKVQELVDSKDFPETWKFTEIQCRVIKDGGNGLPMPTYMSTTNGTNGTAPYHIEKNMVTVDLVPGREIACEYTNERKTGTIGVVKKTIGGDGKFDFMVSSKVIDKVYSFQLMNGETEPILDLPTGDYTIEEKNLPEGWTLQDISCTREGERTDNKITVPVVYDQRTVCTFTNFKEEDDRMMDVVKFYNYRNLSNLLDHGPDRSRIIRRLGQASPSLKDTPLKYSGDRGTGPRPMSIGQAGTTLLSGGGSDTGTGDNMTGTAFEGGMSPLQQQIGALSSVLGLRSGTSGYPGSGPVTQRSQMPFGMKGSVANDRFTGSVSFSLSQLQQSMASEDARKVAAAKAYGEALGVDGNPYGVRYEGLATTMTPQRWDAWVEFHVSQYDDDLGGISRDGNFGIGYVGIDYSVTPSFLIGILGQFDRTDEDVDDQDLNGEVNGHGWMVGPYVGLRLTDHLYFSGRAAWGKSSNDIELTDNAAGFRTGEFDTDRWLATAELTGNWQRGRLRFTPAIELAYGNQDQEAFRNSLGQLVASSDMTIGRLTFGPEFAYTYTGKNGTLIEPLVAMEGIWNFDTDSILLSDGTVIDPEDDLRGRVTGGLMLRRADGGMSLRVVGEYDGIGDDDFVSYGAQIWLNFPLQR